MLDEKDEKLSNDSSNEESIDKNEVVVTPSENNTIDDIEATSKSTPEGSEELNEENIPEEDVLNEIDDSNAEDAEDTLSFNVYGKFGGRVTTFG